MGACISKKEKEREKDGVGASGETIHAFVIAAAPPGQHVYHHGENPQKRVGALFENTPITTHSSEEISRKDSMKVRTDSIKKKRNADEALMALYPMKSGWSSDKRRYICCFWVPETFVAMKHFLEANHVPLHELRDPQTFFNFCEQREWFNSASKFDEMWHSLHMNSARLLQTSAVKFGVHFDISDCFYSHTGTCHRAYRVSAFDRTSAMKACSYITNSVNPNIGIEVKWVRDHNFAPDYYSEKEREFNTFKPRRKDVCGQRLNRFEYGPLSSLASYNTSNKYIKEKGKFNKNANNEYLRREYDKFRKNYYENTLKYGHLTKLFSGSLSSEDLTYKYVFIKPQGNKEGKNFNRITLNEVSYTNSSNKGFSLKSVESTPFVKLRRNKTGSFKGCLSTEDLAKKDILIHSEEKMIKRDNSKISLYELIHNNTRKHLSSDEFVETVSSAKVRNNIRKRSNGNLSLCISSQDLSNNGISNQIRERTNFSESSFNDSRYMDTNKQFSSIQSLQTISLVKVQKNTRKFSCRNSVNQIQNKPPIRTLTIYHSDNYITRGLVNKISSNAENGKNGDNNLNEEKINIKNLNKLQSKPINKDIIVNTPKKCTYRSSVKNVVLQRNVNDDIKTLKNYKNIFKNEKFEENKKEAKYINLSRSLSVYPNNQIFGSLKNVRVQGTQNNNNNNNETKSKHIFLNISKNYKSILNLSSDNLLKVNNFSLIKFDAIPFEKVKNINNNNVVHEFGKNIFLELYLSNIMKISIFYNGNFFYPKDAYIFYDQVKITYLKDNMRKNGKINLQILLKESFVSIKTINYHCKNATFNSEINRNEIYIDNLYCVNFAKNLAKFTKINLSKLDVLLIALSDLTKLKNKLGEFICLYNSKESIIKTSKKRDQTINYMDIKGYKRDMDKLKEKLKNVLLLNYSVDEEDILL